MEPIRHSMLPKLAACPKYQPKPGPAGPAAERGTRIDGAVRLALQGDRSVLEALAPEDKGPAEWAVALLLDYKRTGELETREEFLSMHTPGMSHVGTADCLNEKLGWVADLKTGALRDYYFQMLAYSLACMDKRFEQEWVAHVVYCDQRKVVSYRFDYDLAKRALGELLAEVRDPNSQPRACDYCDWCARKETCPAVVRPVEDGLAVVYTPRATLSEMRQKLIDSPQMLADFATAWKAVEKEIAEFALDRVKELLEAGEAVPGWKLSKGAPAEYYDAEGILHVARETSAPLEGIIEALGGKMSATKFAAWTESLGIKAPESFLRQGKAVTRLLQERKKQKELK